MYKWWKIIATYAFCHRKGNGKGTEGNGRFGSGLLMNESIVIMPLCLIPGSRESGWDLSGLVQVRPNGRAADQVDLWFTNPFPLPLTITNARLWPRSQGPLKVCWPVHRSSSLILITVLIVYV